MEKANKAEVSARLETFSLSLFAHLKRQLEDLSASGQLDALRFEDYPENIETRFVGRTGKYAAYVFPSQSIWNIHFLERFNHDILEVAPDATGTTLFAQALLQITGRALRQSAFLVALAVVFLVFADFRKIMPATLSLLSVALGLVWMLGIMRLLGWQYNPINIMAVPIVLGIGIDSGVHIVHRFEDSGGDMRAAVLTSGRAVLVSSLTTVAGFACLLLSTHRGLITLAQLLLLGMGTCLVASLVLLPAILHILSKPHEERKQETKLI
jgi:predicted RND superfamily exporter protein